MVALSKLADADELENRYLNKLILYVESENDANFYMHCVAVGNDANIEFKGLPGQGGYTAAIRKALEERQHNSLVFALVDGEAAVDHEGGLDALLECDTKVFRLPVDALDGVIFLSEHELENILIRLADLCGFIAHDEPIGLVGRKSTVQLRAQLDEIIDRQLAGAAFKYASMKMTREGKMKGSLRTVFWDVPAKVTLNEVRALVRSKSADWKAFVREVQAIRATIKARISARGPELGQYERIRLSDGKTTMKLMANIHSVNHKWGGHLAMSIIGDSYFDELRDEIEAITSKAA